MAQTVENLPALQGTRVRSWRQEDPLQEGTATHSSVLAWRIPRTEEPGGTQSMGSQELDTTEWVTLHSLERGGQEGRDGEGGGAGGPGPEREAPQLRAQRG